VPELLAFAVGGDVAAGGEGVLGVVVLAHGGEVDGGDGGLPADVVGLGVEADGHGVLGAGRLDAAGDGEGAVEVDALDLEAVDLGGAAQAILPARAGVAFAADAIEVVAVLRQLGVLERAGDRVDLELALVDLGEVELRGIA